MDPVPLAFISLIQSFSTHNISSLLGITGAAINTLLIVAIAVLILLVAFFGASETAFMSASKIRLKSMENNGSKQARKVLRQLEKPDSILSTSIVGNNIATITAASLGTVLFARIIVDSPQMSTLVSTAVLTLTALFLGDLIPKSIAKEAPEKAAIYFYPFIRFWQIIFYPLVMVFGLWRKIFKPKAPEPHTSDEILTFVEEAENDGEIDSSESQLIRSAIEFDDVDIYDIMVPRVNVVAVSETDSLEEIAAVFNESGFSRLPVYHGTIDTIIGVLHEKDFHYEIKGKGRQLTDVIKKSLCLSPNMKILAALRTLQKAKMHMAIVVDEFGGTGGVVTLEDILEELVGEIYDEHDVEEVLVRRINDTNFVVLGQEKLEDMFEAIGFDSREEFNSSSVGGWVTEQMEKIPLVGESFKHRNLLVRVTKATARRVSEVRVEILPVEESEEDND